MTVRQYDNIDISASNNKNNRNKDEIIKIENKNGCDIVVT